MPSIESSKSEGRDWMRRILVLKVSGDKSESLYGVFRRQVLSIWVLEFCLTRGYPTAARAVRRDY